MKHIIIFLIILFFSSCMGDTTRAREIDNLILTGSHGEKFLLVHRGNNFFYIYEYQIRISGQDTISGFIEISNYYK